MAVELKRIGWKDEPSEDTPIDSGNLKQMENNTQEAVTELEELSTTKYITAWKETLQEISKGDNYIFKIDREEHFGDFFEITNNHEIKVLKNCKAFITSRIFVESCAGIGYVYAKVFVNGENTTNCLQNINEQEFINCNDSGIIAELKENDLITLKLDYTSTSGNPKIRSGKYNSSITIFTI